MKKILFIPLLLLLGGCSYFTNEPESLTASNETVESEVVSESVSSEIVEESSESFPDNDTFENVFDESVIGEDRYPSTTLPDSIPISELRIAIDDFYSQVLPEEEKEVNYERIDGETLNSLQKTFDDNEVYAPLEITVDQIALELGEKTNYIARIVIGMPYEDAEALQENNDILVLNEALSHLHNRIVLVAYYDEDTDTLTPYHLNNSTTSIFSLAESDSPSDNSSIEESSSESESESESETE